MKKLLTMMALLIATPALAQSDPNVLQSSAGPKTPLVANHVAGKMAHRGGAWRSDIGVYDEQGALIGADPDPNVRLELRKDAGDY